MARSGGALVVWSIVFLCHCLTQAIGAADDTVNADENVKQVIDKRSTDNSEQQLIDQGDKRAFGWGPYQWDNLQSDHGDDSRSKRPFGGLLNIDRSSSQHKWGARNLDKRPFGPMYEDKRPRTFSFGKREENEWEKKQDEDLDDEFDLGVHKRPFGGNTHNWGSSYDDMMLDKRYIYDSQGKRKFMFGKRSDDDEKRLFKFGKRDDTDDDMDEEKRLFKFGKRENVDRRKFMFGKRDDDDKRKFMFGKREEEEKRKFMFGKRSDEDKRKFMFGKRADDEKRKFMFGKRDDDEKRKFMFGKRLDEEKRLFKFGKREGEEDKRKFMFGKRMNDEEKEKRLFEFGKREKDI